MGAARMMLNHVDLFSGIGGFALGLEATGGFRTTAFCEIDPFCNQVLKKHWPDVPIYNDVRNFEHDGTIHILTGGYPCQPESTAGKRKGESDPRYLWPAMRGIIERHRPRWVIGENVAGHISMGLDKVLADLERAAYTAIPFVIPACAVGAPHRRDRVWILATDSDSERGNGSAAEHGQNGREVIAGNNTLYNTAFMQCDGGKNNTRISTRAESLSEFGNSDWPGIMADTQSQRLQRQRFTEACGGKNGGIGTGRGLAGICDSADPHGKWRQATESGFWRTAQPAVCRMDDGLSDRLDKPAKRLMHLGNAVLPQIPYILGNFILDVEESLLTASL